MTVKPMMAQPIELNNSKFDRQWQRIEREDYYMEPKLDGMRLILEWGPSGDLAHAWTRSGRDVIEMIPIDFKIEVSSSRLAMHRLDCEFGWWADNTLTWSWPLIDFNKTMRVMGSGPEEAQRKAKDLGDGFTAFVFDIPNGLLHTAPYLRRQEELYELLDAANLNPFLELVPRVQGWKEAIYNRYVVEGGEGVMLKRALATYTYGGRPTQTWYKVKKFSTIDVVITGFQPGQGKYEGQVGAVHFALWKQGTLTTIGQCSGMTDEVRKHMSDNWDSYLWEVMEVKYFGFTAGTPRHPQFVRMRPDKSGAECTADQLHS